MAMTLRLDEQDAEALRRQADYEGRSMQEVARQAVRDYIERTSRRELLERVLDEDLDELLYVAERTLGEVEMRDIGLLEAAVARPQASTYGKDAYRTVHAKAAALMHSLARNHALVDGNKRLALAGTLAFYGMNGLRLTLTNDEAYDLVMSVATGELDDVNAIAQRLKPNTAKRGR
jgi:death-on-curing protein